MNTRNKTVRQISVFWIGGLFAMLANMGVTTGLHELAGIRVEIAYASGFAVVMLISFLICRHAVFQATDQPVLPQFVKFISAALVFRGAELAATIALFHAAELHYFVALVSVQVTSFLIKFFFYRAAVFSDAGKAST